MNLYFVLEGDQTEPKVFPKWLEFILPHFSQVYFETDATEHNYYMFSGGGIPSIYNHTVNAIKNINEHRLYNKLIVCLDGEEIGVEERVQELLAHIEESEVVLNIDCTLHIVVQEVCIETWFLGNRRIIKRNPQKQLLKDYLSFYNVRLEDPELLEIFNDSFRTKAQFHYSYFKEVLREKNLNYRKSKPTIVQDLTYLQELTNRVTDTGHINSFKQFVDLLNDIKAKTT
ncbi:hypothetical protein [Parvicella tangerina]|uniref:DUF4276 family protein n=1 Tax=Parvicella tangerina TaxID=2829795 RepID=A0A916JLD1_9FLAO|nr:hypothetical protein [Parvicella tangerina]CAG5080080.1 hypothetical protein CRYO30217_01176 [Parvicella tangerina]